jgi:hypothetical protein
MEKLLLAVLTGIFAAQPVLSQETSVAVGKGAGSAELSSMMVRDISALLDQLIGKGRARVYVHLEGSSAETETQNEVLTPKSKESEAAMIPPPPGYPYPFQYLQKEQQHSRTSSGFVVQKMHVSVLLDKRVPQDRADIVSPWKDLLASPEVARTVIAQASMIVGLLLVCLIAYLLGMRVARGLGEAIASRRPAAPEAAMGMGLPPGQAAFPAGGPPTMGDLEGAPQEALRLPYQPHFSCLTSKPIHEVVRVLEAEPPEDIAMALTWLADRAPEVGAKLFAALSEPFRLQVSRAMAGISQADPERISLLDSKLKTQVEFSIRGTEKLSKLLGPMPREQREGLLRNLAAADRRLTQEVAAGITTFEDLGGMRVEALRRLVAAVPMDVWTTAVSGVDEAFVNRVAELLPEGMRPTILEGRRRSLPKDKVIEARAKVLAQAAGMAAQGVLDADREPA